MKCPKCQTVTVDGQKFCGSCGQPLQRVCSGCGAASALAFRFCGQCGKNLADVGNMMLDRAGIVRDADQTALTIVEKSLDDVIGRPFSFFVSLDDMVVYFANWNELVSTRDRRNMEIELNTGRQDKRFAEIELSISGSESKSHFHMGISDITEHRQARDSIQDKDDLLNLVFTIASDLEQIDDAHRKLAVCDILEKVGLFVGGQSGFVCRIDRRSYSMDTYCRWQHPDWKADSDQQRSTTRKKSALGSLRHILAKLQKEQAFVVNDVKICAKAERQEFQAWQGIRTGAVLLQAIYSRRHLIGVMGMMARQVHTWPQASVMLIRLVSRLLADVLQIERPSVSTTPDQPFKTRRPAAEWQGDFRYSGDEKESRLDVEMSPEKTGIDVFATSGASSDDAADQKTAPSMTFESEDAADPADRLRVFAQNDGRFRINCPACRQQDFASPDVFAEKGFALKVGCPCGHVFSIMRELRRSYRKKVQLDGFFSRMGPSGKTSADGAVWGPMVVKDISKDGLGFTSHKASILNSGDSIQIQFNLDNDTQTLIKKEALVKSVVQHTVGCQFIGSDRYDVSLGFYFL